MTPAKMQWIKGDKYDAVASYLRDKNGTLLDIGSRDKILKSRLQSAIRYHSADVEGAHDLIINLEKKLEVPDKAYDYVVALDVLEHVENIHLALGELSRIARTGVIIALPNMAALSHRWSFFWSGRLATGKYDLLLEHQGDRHRWFTIFSQMNAFITDGAEEHGFRLGHHLLELDKGVLLGPLFRAAARMGLIPPGVMAHRCIYFLERTKE